MTGSRLRGAVRAAASVLALVATGCAAGDQATPEEAATVVHVVDGDTFDAEFPDGTVERVRTPQIDTPEHGECGYGASGEALQGRILGETVELVPTEHGPDKDPYGRLLRAAEVDGDDVGQLLVEDGFARWERGYADEDPRLAAMYEAAEQEARDRSAGFWAECDWS